MKRLIKSDERILLAKILQFQIDEPETAFPFVKRLANENGWTLDYATRVMLEYKKFLFLCTITTTGVTPSDPVDQAWHLHMIYTNSYWNKLCKETLNKQIHHNPTKGGNSENVKYNGLYDQTREMYNQYFGEQPTDIWPDNAERFSDIRFQRVNTKRSWIIPKPKIFITNRLFSIILAILGLSFIAMKDDDNNETFWIIVIGVIVLVVLLLIIFGGGNKKNRGGGSSSSGSSGCGFFFIGCGSSGSSDSSSHGSSGCGSSGCSSGCGGGGCGGGCSS